MCAPPSYKVLLQYSHLEEVTDNKGHVRTRHFLTFLACSYCYLSLLIVYTSFRRLAVSLF